MNTDASGTWAVAFWIKTSTAGAVVMYQGDGTWSSAGQTTFLLNSNSASVAGTRAGAVRWAGGFLTGTAALNDNNWHFITVVDNAGVESIYVDGNVDTVTSTMGLPLASGANQIWIGGSPDYDSGAVKIKGLIDEVRMFNRALSQTEVQALYNTNSLFTTPGNVLPVSTRVTVASGAALDLSGMPQTVASLAGSGAVTNTGGPATLTVSSSTGTTTFSGNIGDASSSNALSFVQAGAGTTVLAGANSYHGTTTVKGGTLLVNGSIGGGGVTVSSGTFGGAGTVNGSVTVQSGGTLSPGNPTGGNSVGTLTIMGNLVLNNSSALVYGLGFNSDLTAVTGNLTLGGVLTVTDSGGLGPGNYTLITYSGTLVNNGLTVNPLPYGLTGTIMAGGGMVVLQVAVRDWYTFWAGHYGLSGANTNGNADATGAGMSNTNRFLAGFNPTNSAAYLHIISIVRTNSNTDIEVTYLGANGDTTYTGGPSSRTNVLEFAPGMADGSYSNAFASTGQTNILSGGTGLGVVTNMVDRGGATNSPARYYRVRVLLP
jgi:fibronectin-binding autotransporter adhesin